MSKTQALSQQEIDEMNQKEHEKPGYVEDDSDGFEDTENENGGLDEDEDDGA